MGPIGNKAADPLIRAEAEKKIKEERQRFEANYNYEI